MTADGTSFSSLRKRYHTALSGGESSLRALLGSASASWRPVAASAHSDHPEYSVSYRDDASTSSASISGPVEGQVSMHRKRMKGAPDVIRATCMVPVVNLNSALEAFRAALCTSEVRSAWDSTMDKLETLEIVEPGIKVVRAYSKIGWPSSSRDYIGVQKVIYEPGKRFVHLTVSLPRNEPEASNDPPFLQPSPPYIRSHVHICAFVVTFPEIGKAQVSLYWQWDLKTTGMIWTTHVPSMPSVLRGLVNYSREYSGRLPFCKQWGRNITVDIDEYDTTLDCMEVLCGVFQDKSHQDQSDKAHLSDEKGKDRRRLERVIEVRIPEPGQWMSGWDIKIESSAKAEDDKDPTWSFTLSSTSSAGQKDGWLSLWVTQHTISDDYASLRLHLQRLAGGRLLKINGTVITPMEPGLPPEAAATKAIEAGSAVSAASDFRADGQPALSLFSTSAHTAHSHSTTTSLSDGASFSAAIRRLDPATEARRAFNVRISKTYSTFLALLQSPAAKWRFVADNRNVTTSIYSAIDPTAVPIYKYETTFVNTTMWDILSVFLSDGARLEWDSASGLESIVETGSVRMPDNLPGTDERLSHSLAGSTTVSFWDAKWRGTWASTARKNSTVRITYTGTRQIHVLSKSMHRDDPLTKLLVPSLPVSSDMSALETQTTLQGLAIDQISPTTTSLTLVDQTDLKGWTKTSHSAMAAAVATIGDYVRKHGGVPIVTQMNNADSTRNTYLNTQKIASFAYELDMPATDLTTGSAVIRCDNVVWATAGIHLSVFPHPARVTALVRHRLAEQGSGCWITIEHDLREARSVTVIVQPAESNSITRSRNRVTVNGKPVDVIVEEIKEEELQELKTKKRIRNPALLLDRTGTPQQRIGHRARSSSLQDYDETLSIASLAPSLSIVKPELTPQPIAFYGLEALATVQSLHMEGRRSESSDPAADWLILSHTENNTPIRISKRLEIRLSAAYPLYRVERTIPNICAEDVLQFVSGTDSLTRYKWDDRLANIQPIHTYRHGLSTASWTSKSSFPTRSRIAYIATAHGHMLTPAPASARKSTSRVLFCASSSVPQQSVIGLDGIGDEANPTDASGINPNKLAEYKIFIEAWALETIYTTADDPGEEDDKPIPHCRCEYYTCTDMPSAPGQGAFGSSNMRARFARMFQDLETTCKGSKPALYVSSPRIGLQVQSILEVPPGSTQRWRLEDISEAPSLLCCVGGQAVFTLSHRNHKGTSANASQKERSDWQIDNSKTAQTPDAPRPKYLQNATSSSLIRMDDTEPMSREAPFARMVIEHRTEIEAYKIRCAILPTTDRKLPVSSAALRGSKGVESHAIRLHVAKSEASTSRYTIDLFMTECEKKSIPATDPDRTASDVQKSERKQVTPSLLVVAVQTRQHPLIIEGQHLPPPKFLLDGKQLDIHGDALGAETDDEDDETDRTARLSKLAQPTDAKTDNDGHRLPAELLVPIIIDTSCIGHPIASAQSSEAAQSPECTTLAEQPLKAVKDVATALPGARSLLPTAALIEAAAQPVVERRSASAVLPRKAGSPAKAERTFRTTFVLVVALISFLLGSLLRSFLSPGDYVLFAHVPSRADEAVLNVMDPQRKWRHAMKLFQIPVPGAGRDLIAAFVDRS